MAADRNPALRTQLDRISHKPDLMGGKASIRGKRVTVAMIVNQIATGRGADDILQDSPDLEREDVVQALRYAAWLAEGQDLALADEATRTSWSIPSRWGDTAPTKALPTS